MISPPHCYYVLVASNFHFQLHRRHLHSPSPSDDGAVCDRDDGSTTGCHGCLSPDDDYAPPHGLKLAASTPVDMIEEVEEEEEVDAIQDHEDDMEASSLRASILKEE